jgi:hypothetical protein
MIPLFHLRVDDYGNVNITYMWIDESREAKLQIMPIRDRNVASGWSTEKTFQQWPQML